MRQTSRHNTIPEQNRASTTTRMRGIKYRGGEYDFRQGIQVGPALGDFEGVLTGVASYKGALPLLGDAEAAGRP